MAEVAELINLKDKAAIELFIRCVRKSLWLDTLRYQFERSLWISSAILLLTGLINLFFNKILISLSLTLALLPIVGGVLVALGKMPTFANAASHADNLFKGKSLMTTATELLYNNSSAHQDFSPWIIQQAAHSAKRWHEHFKQPAYHKQNQFPWAAISSAFLGFFLIIQPGLPDKQKLTKVESKTLTADSIPSSVTSLIDEIRREENILKSEALSSEDELTEHFSKANKPALTNADTRPQPDNKQAQANDSPSNINKNNSRATISDNSQGSEEDNNQLQPQNQHADAGIGTQADTNLSSSLHKDDQNLDIKLVNIDLQDGTLVSSNSKGILFKEHQFSGSDKRNILPSTVSSGNTSTAYTTRFSPSQQQYINAYFKSIPMEK